MKKIIYSLIVIVIVVLLGVYFKNNKTSQSNDEIVIGAPLALTGTGRVDGQNIKRGIDLAVSDLKERGISVRVVYEDDATDPKQTVSAIYNILTTNSKVDAFMGPTWSFLLEASASIIDQYQKVSYSPANTSEFISNESEYLFFGAVKNAQKVEPVEKWLRDMRATKVAVLVSKDAWGASHLEPLQKAIERSGAVAVLTEETLYMSESEVYPTLVSKMKSLGVDAILWTGYDQGAIALITRMQNLGLNVPLLSLTGLPTLLVQQGVLVIKPTDRLFYISSKISPEFSEKFYKIYKQYPGLYADSAYDGVMLLVKAIREKPADVELVDYLRSPDFSYSGYQTDYVFDQSGDIKGGEWVVKPLE